MSILFQIFCSTSTKFFLSFQLVLHRDDLGDSYGLGQCTHAIGVANGLKTRVIVGLNLILIVIFSQSEKGLESDSHRLLGQWTRRHPLLYSSGREDTHATGATNSLKRFIWGVDQTLALLGDQTEICTFMWFGGIWQGLWVLSQSQNKTNLMFTETCLTFQQLTVIWNKNTTRANCYRKVRE